MGRQGDEEDLGGVGGGETMTRIYYMKKYFQFHKKNVLFLHFCYPFFYHRCCKSNVRRVVCRLPSVCLFIILTEATLHPFSLFLRL